MDYAVEVSWGPAFELLASLRAYTSTPDRGTLEIGRAWAKQVRQVVGPASDLADLDDLFPLASALMLWLSPEKDTVEGFLQWLVSLSMGDLYEVLGPYVVKGWPENLADLRARRERYLTLLTLWNERYFATINPAILDGLATDAAQKRALIGTTPAQELVEMATGGVHYTAPPGIDTVVLIPQYHYRPWNLNEEHRGLKMIMYPADILPPGPGELPHGLLRLTRAIADENRLRILRFLATEPQSFTDVVRFAGLAKSTVNYHMVALRAAGLVRVHDSGDGPPRYSLRANAIAGLGERLHEFLTSE